MRNWEAILKNAIKSKVKTKLKGYSKANGKWILICQSFSKILQKVKMHIKVYCFCMLRLKSIPVCHLSFQKYITLIQCLVINNES